MEKWHSQIKEANEGPTFRNVRVGSRLAVEHSEHGQKRVELLPDYYFMPQDLLMTLEDVSVASENESEPDSTEA